MKESKIVSLCALLCVIALVGTSVSAAESSPTVEPAARIPTTTFLKFSGDTCAIGFSHGTLHILGSLFITGTSTLLPNRYIKLYKKRATATGWAPTWTFVKRTKTTSLGTIDIPTEVTWGSAWKYKVVFEGTARYAPSKSTVCFQFTP